MKALETSRPVASARARILAPPLAALGGRGVVRRFVRGKLHKWAGRGPVDHHTVYGASEFGTKMNPTTAAILVLATIAQVGGSRRGALSPSEALPTNRFVFIRKGPEEVTEIAVQSSRVLECEAAGNPPPHVQWFKDGRPIDSQNYQGAPLAGLGSTSSLLYMDCMSASDEGEYTCVATTPSHKASVTTRVFLSAELPTLLSPSCGPHKKSVGKGARISVWSPKLMQLQEADALLLCRVSGEPTPKVRWTVGQRPIPDEDDDRGDKYQISDNGDLLIRQLSWNDMGRYTCFARNVFGEDAKTSFVYPLAREE